MQKYVCEPQSPIPTTKEESEMESPDVEENGSGTVIQTPLLAGSVTFFKSLALSGPQFLQPSNEESGQQFRQPPETTACGELSAVPSRGERQGRGPPFLVTVSLSLQGARFVKGLAHGINPYRRPEPHPSPSHTPLHAGKMLKMRPPYSSTPTASLSRCPDGGGPGG